MPPRGAVYPAAGAVVNRGDAVPLVAQPAFLATVVAGGPVGGGGGGNHPCRVAFHPSPVNHGVHAAYHGEILFTPDRFGGPGSALSALCPPDLALGPAGLGAKPAARQQLMNPGFNGGAHPPIPGPALPPNARTPVGWAVGLDAANSSTTGMWMYNSCTPPVLNPAPGVARQPPLVLLHDMRTGAAFNAALTESSTGHLPNLGCCARFGFFAHIIGTLGRDEHLDELRQASLQRDHVVTLEVKTHFVKLAPDAKVRARRLA